MKRIYTQAVRMAFNLTLLTALFGNCTVQDHLVPPDNCQTVNALIAGCPTGVKQLAVVNRKLMEPTAGSGEVLDVKSGDIVSQGSVCLYKGDTIQPFENATSLIIFRPGSIYQYKCLE